MKKAKYNFSNLKLETFKTNQKGMTLPGTLVAVAISGVVLFAMISALQTSYKNYRNLNQLNEFMQTVNEASTILKNNIGDQCTMNINAALDAQKTAGKNINFNNFNSIDKPIPLSINYYNPNGSVANTLLAPTLPDETLRGIEYSSVSFLPKARLTNETIALEIEVVGKKTGEFVSNSALKQNFVIFAQVNSAGNFVSCGSSDSAINDRLCKLTSDGMMGYDAATDSCKNTFAVKCYSGTNPYSASCPQGARVVRTNWNKCKTTMPEPPGWDISKITKNYKKNNGNSKSKDTMPSHYICEENDERSSVECIYEEHLNVSSDVRCQVCCEVANK